MTEGDTLVFVEVRYRGDARHGTGAASVDWRKQAKLVRAAQQFLALRSSFADRRCRFDVIAAQASGGVPGEGEPEMVLDWIRGAFDTNA